MDKTLIIQKVAKKVKVLKVMTQVMKLLIYMIKKYRHKIKSKVSNTKCQINLRIFVIINIKRIIMKKKNIDQILTVQLLKIIKKDIKLKYHKVKSEKAIKKPNKTLDIKWKIMH